MHLESVGEPVILALAQNSGRGRLLTLALQHSRRENRRRSWNCQHDHQVSINKPIMELTRTLCPTLIPLTPREKNRCALTTMNPGRPKSSSEISNSSKTSSRTEKGRSCSRSTGSLTKQGTRASDTRRLARLDQLRESSGDSKCQTWSNSTKSTSRKRKSRSWRLTINSAFYSPSKRRKHRNNSTTSKIFWKALPRTSCASSRTYGYTRCTTSRMRTHTSTFSKKWTCALSIALFTWINRVANTLKRSMLRGLTPCNSDSSSFACWHSSRCSPLHPTNSTSSPSCSLKP